MKSKPRQPRSKKQAIKLPDLASDHFNLGNAYYDKGWMDKAIAEYKIAIELDPNDAKVHFNLGNAYNKKGWINTAITVWKRAIELDPNLVGPHVNLGVAYREKGWISEAIAELERAIELDPDNAVAHCNLGIAYADYGLLDQAIEEYKRAIKLDPNYAEAHTNLGIVYDKRGRIDKAITQGEVSTGTNDRKTMLNGGEPERTNGGTAREREYLTIKGSGVVEAPNSMKPRRTYPVQVRVIGEELPTGIEVDERLFKETINLMLKPKSSPVVIIGKGEAFDISPKIRKVTVPLWGERSTVIYHVTPKASATGDKRLFFEFHQEDKLLGVANLTIKISSVLWRALSPTRKVIARVPMPLVVHV